MNFINEVLVALLVFIYGLFIKITYNLTEHYIKNEKVENLRDIVFWIFHIVLFVMYYDSICDRSFRFYDFLFLLIGYITSYKFITLDKELFLIDKILIKLKCLLKVIKNNLLISETFKKFFISILNVIKKPFLIMKLKLKIKKKKKLNTDNIS